MNKEEEEEELVAQKPSSSNSIHKFGIVSASLFLLGVSFFSQLFYCGHSNT
jgi:hypothetical protein